jgi:hypothetical protein
MQQPPKNANEASPTEVGWQGPLCPKAKSRLPLYLTSQCSAQVGRTYLWNNHPDTKVAATVMAKTHITLMGGNQPSNGMVFGMCLHRCARMSDGSVWNAYRKLCRRVRRQSEAHRNSAWMRWLEYAMRKPMVRQFARTIPNAPRRLWNQIPPARLTAENTRSHLFCC